MLETLSKIFQPSRAGKKSRDKVTERARSCFIGLIAGDCIGSVVKAMPMKRAIKIFPQGPRLSDAPQAGLEQGQPSAVAEMAIALARMLARYGAYDETNALRNYKEWVDSEPFQLENDIKAVIAAKAEAILSERKEIPGRSNSGSALARCVPIAAICSRMRGDARLESLFKWAALDASMTHFNKKCLDAAAIFAALLSEGMETGLRRERLFTSALRWGKAAEVDTDVLNAIKTASGGKLEQPGMTGALRTLCYALWHASHIKEPDRAVGMSALSGDCPSSSAAATGALVGIVHGLAHLPSDWLTSVSVCRPKKGNALIRHPRPRTYWPADIESLAVALAWSEGASVVPAYQEPDNTDRGPVDQFERETRELFASLLEKINIAESEAALKIIDDMSRIEDVKPAHRFMFADFARGLRKRNLLGVALSHAQKVVTLSPEDPHAYFNLARIYHQMGEFEKARESLAMSLGLSPNLSCAHAMLNYLDGTESVA
jgi:ADP-ribosylglycohydrolase